jgi:hypothetical protein
MTLLGLLNNRYSIAKAFTKKFHDEVKQALRDYEPDSETKSGVYNKHVKDSEEVAGKVPYIFATHESMLASFFESMPDIITSGRSNEDQTKANIIRALYAYLEDKLDLDEFLSDSAWWLFLTGFVSSHSEYKIEIEDNVPLLNDMGEPEMDEMGEPIMIPTYEYHDPVVTVDNIEKIYFSPESEFTIDGKKVPYYLTDKLVDVDEIKHIYDVEVEADETLEVEGYEATKDSDQTDLKRAKMMYYYGVLPSTMADYLQELELGWEYGVEYKIYFTKSKIVHAEAAPKRCKLAKLYGSKTKFFGFGIGKTLKPFQDDMSTRRKQMVEYGNVYANPWLAVNAETKVDQKSLRDKKKRTPLVYTGDKPEYIIPPPMPNTLQQVDEASRSDAQFVSGTLDLSKGAQNTNTVKTATGQQLFAQSQDKRLQRARKVIAKYYREVVIDLMKLCRDNWDDQEKQIAYLNEEGDEQEAIITAADLQGIDFDTDVDFNLDSISVNKDIVSQRWIALLEQSANLPFANLEKVYRQVLRNSFSIPNPESYIKDEQQMQQEMMQQQGMDPGMTEEQNPEELPQEESIGSELAPMPGTEY